MNILKLPVDAIHVGQRQRTDLPTSHITELARDIAENGLIHAVTIDKNNELRAGFCRLNAVRQLEAPYYYASELIPAGFIPAVVVHHNDETALFRLELMENLRRKNLSPVDEARAISRLHKLLHGEHGEGWTKVDTGKELNKLQGESKSDHDRRVEVGDAMLIDSFVNDEDINKAKTRTEAVRIAKKKLEQQLLVGLGALIEVDSEDFRIIAGDCLAVMQTFKDNTFHGIVCDPPYGVNADQFGEQTTVVGHEYRDSLENAMSVAAGIFVEGYRVCRESAHLYMFCDIKHFPLLVSGAELAGWKPFATPLIWHKPGAGHAPHIGFFSRRYECILFAQKGNRTLAKARSDVFEFAGVKDKQHAAEKPVELLAELMSLSYFPGDLILDPCAGSGSIFPAARKQNLRAVGIEQHEDYVNICKKRIQDL